MTESFINMKLVANSCQNNVFFCFVFHTDRQTDRYIKSQDIKVYPIVESERDNSD